MENRLSEMPFLEVSGFLGDFRGNLEKNLIWHAVGIFRLGS